MLHDRYGDDMFFIGSSYYSGTYCKWDYKQKKIPNPKENSIEFKFHELGLEYGFILLDSNQEYTMFFNEFNSWLDDNLLIAPFGDLFDAILFIDEVDMPREAKEN